MYSKYDCGILYSEKKFQDLIKMEKVSMIKIQDYMVVDMMMMIIIMIKFHKSIDL